MATPSFYRERADQAQRDADNASLTNVNAIWLPVTHGRTWPIRPRVSSLRARKTKLKKPLLLLRTQSYTRTN
jgi:hypothetical protein